MTTEPCRGPATCHGSHLMIPRVCRHLALLAVPILLVLVMLTNVLGRAKTVPQTYGPVVGSIGLSLPAGASLALTPQSNDEYDETAPSMTACSLFMPRVRIGGFAYGVLSVSAQLAARGNTIQRLDTAAPNSAAAAGPTGRFYSTAFETKLGPSFYPGVSRGRHFQEANESLFQAMESNAEFAGTTSSFVTRLHTQRFLSATTLPLFEDELHTWANLCQRASTVAPNTAGANIGGLVDELGEAGGIVPDARLAGRGRLYDRPIHHIATDKDAVLTPEFENLFSRAGMDLQSPYNRMRLPGHVGPHGQFINRYTLDRLETAVGASTGAPARAALIRELKAIRRDLRGDLGDVFRAPASGVDRRGAF